MPQVGCRTEPVCFVQIPPARNRGKNLAEVGIMTMRIVHVVGCDRFDTEAHANLGEHVVAFVVTRHSVMGQFDVETIAEDVLELYRLLECRKQVPLCTCTRHCSLPTP